MKHFLPWILNIQVINVKDGNGEKKCYFLAFPITRFLLIGQNSSMSASFNSKAYK